MNKREGFGLLWKGFVIGGTMTVPGVSGGTMAILLGIYHKLLRAVNTIFTETKESLGVLILVALGGGAGLVTCSGLTLQLLTKYPMLCGFFFMGAVAGGMPGLLREAKITKVGGSLLVYPVLGMGMIGGISLLPQGVFSSHGEMGLLFWISRIVCGIVVAIALILPGISVSHMLLLLGLYEYVMQAVSSFQWFMLLPLGLGVGLGVFLVSGWLEKAMFRYPQVTYLIILGFVLGSIWEIFPGIPKGASIFPSLAIGVAGFLFTFSLSGENSYIK